MQGLEGRGCGRTRVQWMPCLGTPNERRRGCGRDATKPGCHAKKRCGRRTAWWDWTPRRAYGMQCTNRNNKRTWNATLRRRRCGARNRREVVANPVLWVRSRRVEARPCRARGKCSALVRATGDGRTTCFLHLQVACVCTRRALVLAHGRVRRRFTAWPSFRPSTRVPRRSCEACAAHPGTSLL